MVDFLWNSVLIGIGGTVTMDLWALLLAAVALLLAAWGVTEIDPCASASMSLPGAISGCSRR